MGKDLRILPRFEDRWSHLYLEQGRLEKEQRSLAFCGKDGTLSVPIDQLGLVILGPGTTVTHAAMKALAEKEGMIMVGVSEEELSNG